MARTLFSSRSETAYTRYTRHLTEALKRRQWVYDPSFALQTDDDVYDKVRRDALAAHVMQQRRHMVAGRGYTIEPRSDSPQDKLAAQIMDELVEQITMFGDARFQLAQAVFRGSSYAFVAGEWSKRTFAGVQLPLQWWVPKKLVNVDRRRWRLGRLEDGGLGWHLWSVERETWEPVTHPHWFVKHAYNRSEDTLGYGRGLLDAMHYCQATKLRVFQQGVKACERYGEGWLNYKTDSLRPGDASRKNDDVATRVLTQLRKHAARFGFVYPKEDELEIMTGGSEGWQLLKEMLAYCDTAVRVLVLGSNLPTEATSGGSFALAEVQENTTETLIQFDRALLGETLTRDLLGLLWNLNKRNFRVLGLSGVSCPKLTIKQEKREDVQVNMTVIQGALQSGIPLLKDEVYEKLNFTQPKEGDEIFEASAQQAAAGMDMPGLPGLGFGSNPGGGSPLLPRELRGMGL